VNLFGVGPGKTGAKAGNEPHVFWLNGPSLIPLM
jgi:hypothetical protein